MKKSVFSTILITCCIGLYAQSGTGYLPDDAMGFIDTNRLVRNDAAKHDSLHISKLRESTKLTPELMNYDSFELWFVSIGVGSNFGDMKPVFHVSGTSFIYSSEQSSYIDNGWFQKHPPDTLLIDQFRKTAIDSILDIIAVLGDSSIWVNDWNVMSGGMQIIDIVYLKKHVHFTLWNASHPLGEQIMEILNSYIPKDMDPLYILGMEMARFKEK